VDQTRFKTQETGLQVAKDLELSVEQRAIDGDSFELSLVVLPYGMPSSAELEVLLQIIVDRPSPTALDDAYRLANGDRVVDTTARFQPDGESFKISILFQMEKMHDEGADVVVSKDVEQIIVEEFTGEITRQLLE